MPSFPQLTRDDVLAAAERIAGNIVHTPLLEAQIRGHRVWLKCESRQTGGAFKLRGATNRLLQLNEKQREKGVVAFSSGNHAQGVAIAAKRLGIRAVIVMPSDAPVTKVEGTRAQGAKIVFYDRKSGDRVEIARRIAEEGGATVVPSFDDPHIVAGQGTVGIEIVEQLGELGLPAPARIVVNCGGGGLASGIALAVPECAMTIVEPEGWDDMARSLELGRIVPVSPDAPETLCDALQTPRVASLTFDILAERGVEAVAVSNAEVIAAIRWAWNEHRLTLEGGGAAALAATLSGKVAIEPETAIVLSGGNIDPELHARLVG